MALVSLLSKIKITRFAWSADAAWPHSLLKSPPSAALDRQFKVIGYPTREEIWKSGRLLPQGTRRPEGRGYWLLSTATQELQRTMPVRLQKTRSDDLWAVVVSEPDCRLWLYRSAVYCSDDKGLKADDVRALVNFESNKRRLMIEKAHALQTMTENLDKPKRRETIPQQVRVEVWQRDGGRCVECDSQERLEFDHIIPVAMGGSNTARNLQLLCEGCNRRKGATLG